ncbi:MAG: DJ-1/PfpI family protein [Sphingomonadales bacterium]|jgi:cyclohexyl-isocyanide hydratase
MQDLNIGFLLFPDLTQLDMTGPFEVFSHIPGAKIHLIWKALTPVASDKGLIFQPNMSFDQCPDLDILCIPGGKGQRAIMEDAEVLEFIKRQGKNAKYVTSVCSGALLLGAAGLLDGYRATTHWNFKDELAEFGAIITDGRVVRDRNRFTGGGVTAGIDFALTIVAELFSEDLAKLIQLGLEYDPHPPFDSGSPEKADAKTITMAKMALEKL